MLPGHGDSQLLFQLNDWLSIFLRRSTRMLPPATESSAVKIERWVGRPINLPAIHKDVNAVAPLKDTARRRLG